MYFNISLKAIVYIVEHGKENFKNVFKITNFTLIIIISC